MGRGQGSETVVDVQRKRGIALPAPERGFRLQERDGLTLVSPRASKHTWAAEERWFRSLIVNRRGEVVSCGFPKFFNIGKKFRILTEISL